MRNRRIGLVALGLFILIDIVLIALALRSGSGGAAPKAAADAMRPAIATGASANASANSNASPAASNSADTNGATGTQSVPMARMAVLNGDGSLLAVTPGACGFGGASGFLQNPVTNQTTTVSLPNPVIAAVDDLPNGTDFVVGSAADCADFLFYAKEGDSWGNGLPLAQLFALVPRDNGLIVTPEWGVKDAACPVLSLATTPTGKAVALCSSGQVEQVTADGMASRGTLPGGLAMVAGPADILYAAAKVEGCNGIAVMTSSDLGTNWLQKSCIAGATTDGAVGIAQRDRSLAVVDARGRVYRSSDDGATFLSS